MLRRQCRHCARESGPHAWEGLGPSESPVRAFFEHCAGGGLSSSLSIEALAGAGIKFIGGRQRCGRVPAILEPQVGGARVGYGGVNVPRVRQACHEALRRIDGGRSALDADELGFLRAESRRKAKSAAPAQRFSAVGPPASDAPAEPAEMDLFGRD